MHNYSIYSLEERIILPLRHVQLLAPHYYQSMNQSQIPFDHCSYSENRVILK